MHPNLFTGRLPSETVAPTLPLRATEPLGEWSGEGQLEGHARFPRTAVDVPSNHFTMMREHASEAAWIPDEWLRSSLAT